MSEANISNFSQIKGGAEIYDDYSLLTNIVLNQPKPILSIITFELQDSLFYHFYTFTHTSSWFIQKESLNSLFQRKAQAISDEDEDESEDSDHEESCHVCDTGGHLILCDTCPLSYHFDCHDPPLRRAPR